MALTTMKVAGSIQEGFRTKIDCSHPFTIDQPSAMGGNDAGPNPLEVFLSSLPACICAIGRIISNQKRLNVRAINATVEGDIDKDYLLGKTDKGRAGFTELRVKVDIDADMTEDEKEAFLSEIERRCPIADNISFESNIKAEVVSSVTA